MCFTRTGPAKRQTAEPPATAWDTPPLATRLKLSLGLRGSAPRRSNGVGRLPPGLLSLVLFQPALQQRDRCPEVILQGEQQGNVVKISPATEAVGQVVARVDRGPQLAAPRTEEVEVALAHL
jgi:hypothetical protein